MERDSAVFYRSFYEAAKELPGEVQTDIYKAMFEYAFYKNEIELKGTAKAIFTLIKPQLDANIRKFENGKNGGRPKKEENQDETKNKPKNNQDETKQEGNENVSVSENASVNENLNENVDVAVDEDQEINLNANGRYFLNNKNSKLIIKAFMQEFHIKDEMKLVEKLKAFNRHCVKYNKLKKTPKDYREHFNHWLTKEKNGSSPGIRHEEWGKSRQPPIS